ncbi:MAG: hypothetical protein A3D65_06045 [Candidatus Lloydbacteria bacterium RIFCSPHIGHO2_02_FULL_50_13]|uniref:Uncharacterized protein n=1 Tax=Candidatus Lloydbacteria bacterium RIFCSPHIGHO2_02_FULL_50_13 TaxID=1798661 RepID=A0A1G2D3L5_9BACT|nr:MAG: hypothetical protein A3D65_06045 [Candidatus Lloydbacteria bacterium RIFCSPHIGHO2_02_FULL_50_13]
MLKEPTPLLLPEHEATALVRSMLREQLMRGISGFLEKYPDHPNAFSLTDPKRWEVRFAEIIGGLSGDVKVFLQILHKVFIRHWDELSEPERVRTAQVIARHIFAVRVLPNALKDNPSVLLPENKTIH